MKIFGIILIIGLIILSYFIASAPQKKLKCLGDHCAVFEKSKLYPKPRITGRFLRSEVKSVDIATRNGTDYIVVVTSTKKLYLKFIHNASSTFKSKQQLKADANKFFINIVNSNEDIDTNWRRDLGSIQLYMFGKPIFN